MKTAEEIADAAQVLPSTWQKLNAQRQRTLFGAVVFGRKEVMQSNLYKGFLVRIRVGRDVNGMPKYHEHFMSYQAVADWVNQLRQFATK